MTKYDEYTLFWFGLAAIALLFGTMYVGFNHPLPEFHRVIVVLACLFDGIVMIFYVAHRFAFKLFNKKIPAMVEEFLREHPDYRRRR